VNNEIFSLVVARHTNRIDSSLVARHCATQRDTNITVPVNRPHVFTMHSNGGVVLRNKAL
jgi:hypothetical protein